MSKGDSTALAQIFKRATDTKQRFHGDRTQLDFLKNFGHEINKRIRTKIPIPLHRNIATVKYVLSDK